jgi:hypothetical protein
MVYPENPAELVAPASMEPAQPTAPLLTAAGSALPAHQAPLDLSDLLALRDPLVALVPMPLPLAESAAPDLQDLPEMPDPTESQESQETPGFQARTRLLARDLLARKDLRDLLGPWDLQDPLARTPKLSMELDQLDLQDHQDPREPTASQEFQEPRDHPEFLVPTLSTAHALADLARSKKSSLVQFDPTWSFPLASHNHLSLISHTIDL